MASNAVTNKIIEDLQVSEIYDFSKWTNPEPNSPKAGIFKRIIRPAVENFIKWNNNIEDLLLLWPFLVNPSNDFNISEIKAKFKNSINKAGHISESLRDGAVPILQEKIEMVGKVTHLIQNSNVGFTAIEQILLSAEIAGMFKEVKINTKEGKHSIKSIPTIYLENLSIPAEIKVYFENDFFDFKKL